MEAVGGSSAMSIIETVGDDHRTFTRIVVPTVSRRSAKGGGRTVRTTGSAAVRGRHAGTLGVAATAFGPMRVAADAVLDLFVHTAHRPQ